MAKLFVPLFLDWLWVENRTLTKSLNYDLNKTYSNCTGFDHELFWDVKCVAQRLVSYTNCSRFLSRGLG